MQLNIMEKNKTDYRIVMMAIAGIVALELGALFNGVNGTYFTIALAMIAGLAGWSMPQLKFK